MSSEHRNRTNKAQAIAAALVTVGVTANEAAELPDATWRIAALAGWHIAKAEQVEGIALRPWTSVSDATRREVRELLAADEARQADDEDGLTGHQVDEAFAGIAAGVPASVRPAQDPDQAPATVHLSTGAGTVRCGAPMGHWRDNPGGWDLGTVTVDHAAVTCTDCALPDPYRSSGAVLVSAAGVPDLHPAARHTLNCLAGFTRPCSC